MTEFKPGDRVAAFHEMMQPHGSYAEYAIAWAHTTFHIPKSTTFEGKQGSSEEKKGVEADAPKTPLSPLLQALPPLTLNTTEAAAIPLAAMTAAVGLYLRLGLPEPWQQPATPPPTPLVIYGAASAVGSYAVQLASRSNIHPLICVAGRGAAHVEGLIDRTKGDTIVDYRQGGDAVVEGIEAALPAGGALQLLHAYDAVSDHGSYIQLGDVLAPGGKIALVLPGKYDAIPAHVVQTITSVGAVHNDAKDFGFVWFRLFTRGLKEGWFKPQPQEVVPGGLAGVQTALENLRDGKVSAVKYVFRIADTVGAGES